MTLMKRPLGHILSFHDIARIVGDVIGNHHTDCISIAVIDPYHPPHQFRIPIGVDGL